MQELKKLSEEEYKKLSLADKLEYDKARYLADTDNLTALNDLVDDFTARQQGDGDVWATGFDEFDKKLDGGFMGEQLIILGAISSLGKTSFALQIAAQMAENERDVLIFSLEMSKNELNAKTISRYSHILTMGDAQTEKARLTTRDILSGRTGTIMGGLKDGSLKGDIFENAYEAAKIVAKHTRIVVGENNIDVDAVRGLIDLHIKATGRRPFVILDYLQILQQSEGAKTGDKRLLTDYDVSQLKTISRDFHIPILVISAFNRTSYLEPVSVSSFRESSGIEYSSDILLAMQYDGMDYQKHWFTKKGKDGKNKSLEVFESTQNHNQRVRELLSKMDADGAAGRALPIELKVLKNRNGTKGPVYFSFLPAYNYYAEAGVSSRYVMPEKWIDDMESADDEEEAPKKKKKSLPPI